MTEVKLAIDRGSVPCQCPSHSNRAYLSCRCQTLGEARYAEISSDSSESWPTFYGATRTHYRTGFVYEKYLVECDGYQTQVNKFAGGTTTASATPPSASYCRWFMAGSTFKKYSSSAFTYSGGVDISGTIGIDLSAHTGYSTSAELKYKFNTGHDLCGTDDYPGGTPKRLVAGTG